MNLEDLKKPFPSDQIEWRLAQCGQKNGKIWGMCLAYVQARAVMDRLDEVCGPGHWKVEYSTMTQVGAQGVIATLSIKIGEEWVAKQDGAEPTEIESFKGGLSSALKRAGSVWGIGRYLYDLESGFVQVVEQGTQDSRYGKTKDGTVFYWLPPRLPSWALPTPPNQHTPVPHMPTPKEADKVGMAGLQERDRLVTLVKARSWTMAQVAEAIQCWYRKEKITELTLTEFEDLYRLVSSKTYEQGVPKIPPSGPITTLSPMAGSDMSWDPPHE